MKNRSGLIGRESGQGTLEYILILMTVIIIILSLMYQFHGAFRTYAQALFDGYFACLLEVGELPGRGGDCKMPAFDTKNARSLAGNGSSSDGKSGKGSGDKNKKSNSGANGSQAGQSGGSGGGGGGGGGGGSRRSGGSGRIRSSEAGTVANSGEATFGGEDQKGASITIRGGRMQRPDRPAGVKMDMTADGYVEEKRTTERPKQASTQKKLDESGGLRPVKSVENPPRQLASVTDVDGKGFTFGAFIRWAIIILIIIAMVVFFGGQLLQISKSSEKGGGD